jgi:hypothetical protein
VPNYWIVDRIQTGNDTVRDPLWDRWYTQRCVAVGFPPTEKYAFDGPSDGRNRKGWANARNRLKQVQIGDKVIPFTKKWQIGPVGIVKEIRASDEEW